jgi:hypothetical protein
MQILEDRRTVVCRSDDCRGGGWWGEVPVVCPHCKGKLVELPRVLVVPL